DEDDLKQVATAISQLVKDSKKVKHHPQIEKNIYKALLTVKGQMDAISVVEFQKWKLAGLRLDLNFSASGEVKFFAKFGVKFRARLDWKVSQSKSIKLAAKEVSGQTKFVLK